jgi:hypothetical protein
MKTLRARMGGGDEGSILIMSMLFLLLMASVVLAPLALADTNLRATVSLHGDRSLQYAAQSALDKTIAYFRSDAGRNEGLLGAGTSFGSACPNPTDFDPDVSTTENGEPVDVWVSCAGLQTANPSVMRDVTFAICRAAPPSGGCSASDTLLTAEAVFYDINGSPPSVWLKNYSIDY